MLEMQVRILPDPPIFMEIGPDTKLTAGEGWLSIRLDNSELLKLQEWMAEHYPCNGSLEIAQSGASGIGANSVVRCSCGEGLDITDYGAW
jgi:hypothetical protein